MSKTGYCSLCKHPKVIALNNAIAAGKGYTVAVREMEEYGWKFAKATFLAHKSHITSPLLTAAEEARKNPVIVPKSNRAILEMIRDLGAAQMMDPDNKVAVNVNQTLRAAKILQDAEGKQESVLIILAKSVMGPVPEEIEGHFMELTTEEVN